MKQPKRREVPVFIKEGGKLRLIDYVSCRSTSIGAAKAAGLDSAKFSFIDNSPAWIAFNQGVRR